MTLGIQKLKDVIDKLRLKWFRHLMRNGGRMPRRAMKMIVNGTRTSGRSKTKWLDQMKMN